MGFNIEGNTSGNIAKTDGYNNLVTTFPIDIEQAGFINIASEVDTGDITDFRNIRNLEVSRDYRLRVGTDTILFSDNFSNTTLNSSLWTAPITTMSIVCANGFCTLNSDGSVAGAVVARLQTYKYFPIFGPYGTYFEIICSFANPPIANNVTEWGAGISTASTAPTDGAFFRLNSNGEFRCVFSYNSTEVMSNQLDFQSLVGTNLVHDFVITITDDSAEFWIDDILVAKILRQVGSPAMVSSNCLPVFIRTYNVAATVLAQKVNVGQVSVTLADMLPIKSSGHISCGEGQMAYQLCSNWGSTNGQTAQYAVSANPSAAAPKKNLANLGTGLGGVFLANIPLLNATDGYVISSYQVPAGTKTVPGRSLFITAIEFDVKNEGATSGADQMTWLVLAGFGATQVDGYNTNGIETATAKISRYVPLGVQTLPGASVAGTQASPSVVANFKEGPIVVNPGEFIQILIKFITYTSTTSQAFWCYSSFSGYFE